MTNIRSAIFALALSAFAPIAYAEIDQHVTQDGLRYIEYNEYQRGQTPRSELRECRTISYIEAPRYPGHFVSKQTSIFCLDSQGRNVEVGDPKYLQKDYLRSSQMAVGYLDAFSVDISKWLGRKPDQKIDGVNLFEALERPLWNDILSFDPALANRRDYQIIYSAVHVAAPAANSPTLGATGKVFWFTFCVFRECVNPETQASKMAVFVVRTNERIPGPSLVIASTSPNGRILCGVTNKYGHLPGQGCYRFKESQLKISAGQGDIAAAQYWRSWNLMYSNDVVNATNLFAKYLNWRVEHCHDEYYSYEEQLIYLTDKHSVCDGKGPS